MPEPSPQFPDTRWSLIVSAREGTGGKAEEALDSLCRAYWTPLYAFARRWGADVDAAQDLVQEFLSRFIERGDLVRSSPQLGKFRSFLLAAFQNHLISALRREKAEKRGGKVSFISIEDTEREERWQTSLTSPEQAFDLRWAEETMRRAMSHVEAEYQRAGNEAVFQALRPALSGEKMEDMTTVGNRLGMSAGAAGSAVFRMRAKFREALRDEVSHTVAEPGEVDGEIRYLLTLLAN